MLVQCIDQSLRTPKEDTAIPEVVSGFDKVCGSICVRLLGEAVDLQRSIFRLLSRLDVSIARLWPGWGNTDNDNILTCRSDGCCALEVLVEFSFVADYVIGREQA